VGVPAGLVTLADKVTGFFSRAGVSEEVRVTVGAEVVGGAGFTNRPGKTAEVLELNTVLVRGSSAPLVAAEMLLCWPATNGTSSAAMP
jgi:hypothetical protein